MKNTFGWVLGMTMIFVLVTTAPAAENEFFLQGEGRARDMTSLEKTLLPDQDLVITITGNSRYRMESTGKFSLYGENRQKIEEIRFALQTGETKSWTFPAAERLTFVSFGVYGKGEIKVMMEQGAENAVQAEAENAPAALPPQPLESDAAHQSPESFILLLREAEQAYLGGKNLRRWRN